MAGAKGKSGGIRPNSGGVRPNSGGARIGAGRKPKSAANEASTKIEMEPQGHGGALKRTKATPVEIPECDMLKLLQDVALGRIAATTTQVRAAIAAVQYTHTKKGDGGKKDEQANKATKAAGKFSATTPPKLVVNNR